MFHFVSAIVNGTFNSKPHYWYKGKELIFYIILVFLILFLILRGEHCISPLSMMLLWNFYRCPLTS